MSTDKVVKVVEVVDATISDLKGDGIDEATLTLIRKHLIKNMSGQSHVVSKKSNKANYYAVFHSLLSPKNIDQWWVLSDITFSYQPNYETIVKNESQLKIYNTIHDNPDLLSKVTSFNGKLDEVIQLVENELNVTQMLRTATIWNQFMSDDDRLAYKKIWAYYDGEFPKKDTKTKPIKIDVKIKLPVIEE